MYLRKLGCYIQKTSSAYPILRGSTFVSRDHCFIIHEPRPSQSSCVKTTMYVTSNACGARQSEIMHSKVISLMPKQQLVARMNSNSSEFIHVQISHQPCIISFLPRVIASTSTPESTRTTLILDIATERLVISLRSLIIAAFQNSEIEPPEEASKLSFFRVFTVSRKYRRGLSAPSCV